MGPLDRLLLWNWWVSVHSVNALSALSSMRLQVNTALIVCVKDSVHKLVHSVPVFSHRSFPLSPIHSRYGAVDSPVSFTGPLSSFLIGKPLHEMFESDPYLLLDAWSVRSMVLLVQQPCVRIL